MGRIMIKKITPQRRREAIQKLIGGHSLESQQKLMAMLVNEYGIETTQAVISRDLRILGIDKRNVGGVMIYEPSSIDTRKEILRLGVVSVRYNKFMIVIKTIPGLADFVADCLDLYEDIGILGTVAGENTVFVSPVSATNIEKIFKKVCKVLYYKGK